MLISESVKSFKLKTFLPLKEMIKTKCVNLKSNLKSYLTNNTFLQHQTCKNIDTTSFNL